MIWILIISLFGGYDRDTPAITNIPGFYTYQDCLAAGDAYLKSVNGVASSARAICIPQPIHNHVSN